ncbi:unnamed protein product [Acanthoscelides obtectus]|uniref:Uncharacterized protein n=1 Tax=Acanthoscelides obtectus TaxID=200917 RepID=A0A9P0Q448_ACAOB|nr:unnamed protein product [Acanthoscelides obtectus]CAK1680305.1 hypothetical protein AOBTE_LOCUS32569 [Acanthoscelides obtectus]
MKRSDQDEDAARQWEWLERVLQKFQRNGETKTCLLLDIAVPDDSNVLLKESVKISKYEDLEIEISKMSKQLPSNITRPA